MEALRKTLQENARRLLPKLAEDYFESGRQAASKKKSPKALHRFRIETKRFRYSLELFRPIYGPSLDRRLRCAARTAGLVGLGERLPDHYASCWRAIRSLEAKLDGALKREIKNFRRLWREFDSEGELQRWKNYLRGPAQALTCRNAPMLKWRYVWEVV